MNLITFDMVTTPATPIGSYSRNGRIYSKDDFIFHVEELKRRINRERRKNKIIEIFGDDLFR